MTPSCTKLSPLMTRAVIKFCKLLENRPTKAVKYYEAMVEKLRDSSDITVLEDCAEILANYLKQSSIWKRRIFTELLQKLHFPAKLLILRHFMDFQSPGISIDYILALNDNLRIFQKLNLPRGLVLGENGYGKLGIGPGVSKAIELREVDFQFDKAFHGKNHTIFWRKVSGELWAAGKCINFLKNPQGHGQFYSNPVKLDFVSFKNETPIIELSENYTIFKNFSIERSLFIGNQTARKMYKSRNPISEVEEGKNWMEFARFHVENRKIHVALQHKKEMVEVKIYLPQCTWKCNALKSTGTLIFYFCGKRVPKLPDLTVCDDGSIWYKDLDTLYQGNFFLSASSKCTPVQVVASMNEVPFLYRLGGFSMAPDAKSEVFYGKRRDHFDELMPRHQLDYSKFMNLTYDPWHCYFGTLSDGIEKLNQVEQFLEPRYQHLYNEYGFICDELETLTAIDHLYQLISTNDMIKMLQNYPNDKLAHFIIVKGFISRAKENEQLRVVTDSDVALEARVQVKWKLSQIRKRLRDVLKFEFPPDHEAVWTYLKFIEFIGHFQNRHIGGKGKVETKPNITPYFQTRDVGRIIRRRQEERLLNFNWKKEVVQILAIGHRSDKTKMDHFYMYPMDFFVLKRFLEAVEPRLLNHVDKDGCIDLNKLCDNDPNNHRFITLIKDISGCDHPLDFNNYQKRFFLEAVKNAPDEPKFRFETSEGQMEIPSFLMQIFSSTSSEFTSEFTKNSKFSKNLIKLAFEALFDIRELCHVECKKKFEICQFYTGFQMLEAAADVIKLIVVTGDENDTPIFRHLFQLHPMEMVSNVAKYRPEILFHWSALPFSNEIVILEKIFAIISRKRYQKEKEKPLIIWNELPISSPKIEEKWLREHFTNAREDTEKDVEKWIKKFLLESTTFIKF